MRKVTLGAVALAVSTMIGSAASYADLFGEIWLNEPLVAENLSLFPAGLTSGRDATFTSTAFDYVVGSSGGTIGQFLNNDAATLPGGANGAIANTPLADTVFRFTGTAVAPAGTVLGINVPAGTLGIAHDDGVIVSSGINTNTGNIINAGLGTSEILSQGPLVGAQQITVLFGECCGPPSALISNIDNATIPAPEPASLAILGVALAGFGVMRRRRKTS